MNNTRGVVTGTAALALSAGLLLSTSPVQATTFEVPGQGSNTIQIGAGGDVVQPGFSLWPLPGNNANIHTVSNEAVSRGNNASGQLWLLGLGAGNVVQFATGGTIVAPQVGLGRDNNLTAHADGNFASNSANGNSSVTQGQGLLIDGNGNVWQVAFLQGNVFAPQFNVGADNNADISTSGNWVQNSSNGNSGIANNGFSFRDANGNVYQISILSNNVIAPQFVIDGDNNLVVHTDGNTVLGSANDNSTTVNNPRQGGLNGIFTITTVHTETGNVTQIAILSNNVWAPQIALFGTNRSAIDTDTNYVEDSANGGTSVITGDLPPTPHPVIATLRSVVAPLTGGKTPILDTVEAALPANTQNTGNVTTWAHDSGAIYNNQFAFNLKAPVTVVPDPVEEQPTIVANARPGGGTGDPGGPAGSGTDGGNVTKPHPVRDLIRNSPLFLPGHHGNAHDNTGGGAKSDWKPGDGVKKVVAGVKKVIHDVHDALHPKQAESDNTPSDAPA